MLPDMSARIGADAQVGDAHIERALGVPVEAGRMISLTFHYRMNTAEEA